jgi:tetratricopeptide (TPR) repeat protein
LEALGEETRGDEKELEIRNNIGILYKHMAIDFFKMDQFDLAIERFSIAINFNKTDLSILKGRAECFLAQKYYEKAISDLKSVLEIDVGNEGAMKRLSEIYFTIGKIKISKSDFKMALKYFELSFSFGIANVDIFFLRAKCHFHLNVTLN